MLSAWSDVQDQNGDDFEVVEGSELEVSRMAFADNTNKYFINERTSNFKEVTTLLKDKGIDLDHNRFLILQGEVEQISLMPPKARTEHETGMLEYLEDIIGSNRLVEQIEASGKEVDALNEERGQKVNKLKIVEKDKENLSGAKEEAEEFIAQQRKLILKKSLLYQIHLAEAQAEEAQLAETKAALDEKLAAEREKTVEANKQVAAIEESYQEEKEGYDAIEGELRKAKEEFAVFERKDIKYKEDIKHLKAKAKKLADGAAKEQEKGDKAKDGIVRQEKAIEEAEKVAANMERLIPSEQKVLDAMFEATREETDALRARLAEAEEAARPWAQASAEAQAALDVVKAELNVVEGRGKKAAEALAAAQKRLADAEPTRKAKQAELKAKISAHGKAEKQLAEGRAEHKELTGKEAALRGEVNAVRATLEDSKASSGAAKAQSSVLKCLMDAKKAKKISGIHGRLGDLGTIDGKYDVAVTTACGALNHIVVENTQVAQRCCDLLRAQGAGVATFLMLDKQRGLAERMHAKPASAFPAPRLFDLVKPKDEAFLPAFYFALRDTLVADNLDQAMKHAYGGAQRARVVTLDGNVIDTSGTMSGGGNKVARGGMSSKASDDAGLSADELAKLEKALAKRADELSATRARLQALERAIEGWEREAQQLRAAAERIEMDLEALAKDEAETRANLKVFEEEAAAAPADKSKVKELHAALAANEAALAKALKKSEAEEGKCKKIQEEIMNAGGEKLRMQKKKVDGMNAALEEATATISKGKVALKTAAKTIEKAEAAVLAANEELEATKAQLEATKAEYRGIEEDALKVMESYNATQALLDEKKAALAGIEAEYERVKAAVSKLRAAQVDVENEVADAAKALREAQGKAAHWAQKFEALQAEFRADQDMLQAEGVVARAGAEGAEGAEEGAAQADAMEEDGAEGGAGKAEGGEAGLRVYAAEELKGHKAQNIKYEITTIEEVMARMNPNMAAIAEWRKKEAEFRERQAELDAVTARRDELRAAHDTLRKQRLDEFMAGFSVITMRLKEMYQMITLGGDAELELVDSLDPFSEGIVFSVRPPKKSWKNISNLSGGEKTLSSLSLVFALHHYKPTPLYVMDEIDAALDFKNVSIVANYIKERTKDAQFIIISLRNNMFELADRLVGIYKTHHCTKSVAINPAMLAAHLPAAPAVAAGV
jgi:structural maintenance of chromosome 4